jgi:hypothetical protein
MDHGREIAAEQQEIPGIFRAPQEGNHGVFDIV